MLMKIPGLYKHFSMYDYMLVYQTDAWCFSDNLDHWCELGFDYIGAPWFELTEDKKQIKSLSVGNGGLSLRKVSKMIEITEKYGIDEEGVAEDLYFCKTHKDDLRLPDPILASEFSMEIWPEILVQMNGGKLPMGFHKFNPY